ncbi:MAG: hypothetical protein RR297_08975 [Clostridia bacterium]
MPKTIPVGAAEARGILRAIPADGNITTLIRNFTEVKERYGTYCWRRPS